MLPDAVVENARTFYAQGGVAAEPRQAATVMLVRDTSAGLEVYMMRRARTMVFAGGLYAFPGGGVDSRDVDVRAAAVRELHEETGVQGAQLRLWCRWITPEFEPRRYDTWFYLAAMPDGQQARDISGEASWAGWMSPADALRDESVNLLPPTAVTLSELAKLSSVDEAVVSAVNRDLTPVVPKMVWSTDPPTMALPGDDGYED